MKLIRFISFLISFIVLTLSAIAQTWQPLQNQPPVPVGPSFLMTDGTILFESAANEKDWWKLTPDSNNKGSYVTGTWSQVASLPGSMYAAELDAGVLKDGRFALTSAYDNSNSSFQFKGMIYDPVSNTWIHMTAAPENGADGDSLFSVLPDGSIFTILVGGGAISSVWSPITSQWVSTTQGLNSGGDEEQQATLLPDGSLLFSFAGLGQRYVHGTDQWVDAGTLPTGTVIPSEDGPSVLMYNGKVLTLVGDQTCDIYTPGATSAAPGTWALGPSLPVDTTLGQLNAGDSPACLLPSGNVLLAAGGANSGLQFLEYNGTAWTEVPNPPDAASSFPENVTLLVTPSFQVLYTDYSQDVEVYTPAGAPQSAWRPTITSAPTHITPTLDFTIQGTLFNGWSQNQGHGDDMNNATNYPLLRIINKATGHWFYARTHDHSSMGVATGTAVQTTHFTVPFNCETGSSYFEIEVNGMDSIAIPVTVDKKTVKSLTVSPLSAPAGTNITGTVTLIVPSASNTTVNLSSNTAAAVVPATVTVPAGATQATFPITTVNATYAPISATITARYSTESPNTAGVTVNPANYAQFVSQNMPSSLLFGQQVTATLQFKNTGGTTWDALHGYKLRSLNTIDNTNWGFNRIALSNGPVAPGGTGIFTANIVAPSTPTTYNFSWQMIQDNIAMAFGPASTNVAVKIGPPPDAAKFVSQTSVPTTIPAGATFKPWITYTNIGANTWSAPGYVLRSRNPYNNTTWGTASVPVPVSTATNSSVTFKPTFSAPALPGNYNFQWTMMDLNTGTLFGDVSPNLIITVQPPPDGAQYVSESTIPSAVAPGAVFTGTITMKNIGTNTWDSTYSLATANPPFTAIWGTTSIPVTGTVAPGASFAFTGSFTARMTPGIYHFIWQMAKGFTVFGQQSPDVAITVVADSAHYVSTSSQPATIVAGKDFYVQYTMQNSGTTTWSSAGGYAMMSVNPNGNTIWNRSTVNLPAGSIAPGASALITGLCVSPVTPGTYTMQWQMAKAGVPFGDKTPLASIVVTQGPDDAKFSAQTTIPASIVHSTQFTATITMKNLGTTTWTGPTYSLVPIGSSPFGVASIPAPSTAQFAFAAFTATFTAPATPGTYTFQMRMADGTTKFGQATIPVTVVVA